VIPALFYGAVVGLGIYALVRVWVRPRPGVATLLSRIDAGQRSMSPHTVSELEESRGSAVDSLVRRLGDRLEVISAERGWRLGRVRQDLALMNRTTGAFLAAKVGYGLGFLLLAPVLWAALRVAGVSIAPAVPAAAAIGFGVFGFFLPDLALRSEADRRRGEFRRVVGIFHDLVAMTLAGGRGLPEALLTASTISEHWALVRIRRALANARLFGTTPWAALGELGAGIGVDELRDMSSALALAADDGAKIRRSLSARAATLRRREMADVEGEAGEKSESMLVAQLVICLGFLVFLAYPAVSKLAGQ
jgi:Flp pilus assembly protein TadB